MHFKRHVLEVVGRTRGLVVSASVSVMFNVQPFAHAKNHLFILYPQQQNTHL